MSDSGIYICESTMRVNICDLKASNTIKLCSKETNYALVSGKYIGYKEEPEEEEKKQKKRKKEEEKKSKKEQDKKGKKLTKIMEREFKVDSQELKFISERFKLCESFYKEREYKEIAVSYHNISRLAIGHGEISVREVSLRLDHIFGVPVIPASSVKGAFKNYIDKKSKTPCKDKIDTIFGTESKQGKVIFLDAYPEKCYVKVDVMTPHYGNYYQQVPKEPNDRQNPVPIFFPVVDKGAKFTFKIFVDKAIEGLYENIRNDFKEFLGTSALGAKSSVGYGYFEDANHKG